MNCILRLLTLAWCVTEKKEFYQHDVWRSRNVGDFSPVREERKKIVFCHCMQHLYFLKPSLSLSSKLSCILQCFLLLTSCHINFTASK